MVELTLGLIDLCIDLYEKANKDSSNSSKPPSNADPFKKRGNRKNESAEPQTDAEPREDSAGNAENDSVEDSDDESRPNQGGDEKRKPGKQAGAQGFGRTEKEEPERTEDHWPEKCENCGNGLIKPPYPAPYTGHCTYELEKDEDRNQVRLVCTLHRYHAIVCACGRENKAVPGEGALSEEPGRKRDLKLGENRLVGPMLATFIAALSREYRMSRNKIRQYLFDWFGFRLSIGAIDLCIREAGVACYPIVEKLVEELQEQEKLHLDETPWYQKGIFLWLWCGSPSTKK